MKSGLRLALLSIFILSVAATPVPAHAASTVTVESILDGAGNPLDCPGVNCTLRDAVLKAWSGDTIDFAVTGTITLTNGELQILSTTLSITGPGADQLTVSASDDSRIFNVSQSTLSLSGLTLAHGLANDALYPTQVGGGAILAMNGSQLTLDGMVLAHNNVNCTIPCSNNGINGMGGAILFSSQSALTITNSTFSSNTATLRGGAILFNAGTTADGNDLALTDVTFDSNQALNTASGTGGALEIWPGHLATLTRTTFSSNYAPSQGGGLWVGGLSGGADTKIYDSTFYSNHAEGSASSEGGGIYVGSGTEMLVSRSTLTSNGAGNGGGIANDSGAVGLFNSTLQGNTAGGSIGGGAVLSAGTLILSNDTIAGNSASTGHGGGLYLLGGTPWIRNTIVADSTGSDCADPFATPWSANANNLVETNDGTDPCSAVAFSSDPKLSPLADNGGPTQTMALQADSPVIDQGSNAECSNVNTVNGLDQRGLLRPIDGESNGSILCDVGAFEYAPQQVVLVPASLNFGNQLVGTSSAIKTVTLANGDGSGGALGLTSIAASNAYKLVSGAGTCPTGAATLAFAETCEIQIKYAPTKSGPKPGSVTVTTDAASSPDTVPLSGTGVKGTQLLVNPSFESDANQDNLPDKWVYANLDPAADVRDCTLRKAGACSLKLAGNGSTKTVSQTIKKSGGAGDDFLFNLWSASDSVPAGSVYRLQVKFYNGSQLKATRTINFAIGTHAFKKVTGTFAASTSYTKIVYRITFQAASGTAWFDAASLKWAP